uniref:Cathepsin B n=1 Tax=Rhipicephalus zambeziensis TaxID=60191 RepID=A0A224Y2S1_9ACAR
MKVLAVCALFIVAVQARVMVPLHMSPSSNEMINFINSLNTTWKAGRNFGMETPNKCPGSLAAAIPASESERLPLHIPRKPRRIWPDTFDARIEWRHCRTIPLILNQGNCGSCWAHAVAGAISDRVCIQTCGRVQVNISVQDLMTCCPDCATNGDGCIGGKPSLAWKYFYNFGIVSGGPYVPPEQYTLNDGCRPYSIKPGGCNARAPPCNRTCNEKFNNTYEDDKHYAGKVYRLPKNPLKILVDILYNGPVSALFDVYSDFYAYTSGVYQRHSTQRCTGHVVRIIGWGTENGVPYWLAANSWGTGWGDKGFFKIRRGNNECNIENQVEGGMAHEP